MNATDVIDGAIESVSGNWCQNSLFTEQGQLCLRGALYIGAGAKIEMVKFSDELEMLDLTVAGVDEEALGEATVAVESLLDGDRIPDWNDDVSRSEEDVILILKHARDLVDGR